MPTPQLDKTLEDEKDTLLRMQNWDWCMCKNGKPCIDSEVNINNKLEQAYNLGVTTTIDKVGIDVYEKIRLVMYEEEMENKGTDQVEGWNYAVRRCKKKFREALSTLKQE